MDREGLEIYLIHRVPFTGISGIKQPRKNFFYENCIYGEC